MTRYGIGIMSAARALAGVLGTSFEIYMYSAINPLMYNTKTGFLFNLYVAAIVAIGLIGVGQYAVEQTLTGDTLIDAKAILESFIETS